MIIELNKLLVRTMQELTMADNDDKWPNLEKRMDHQIEIEDDLDSEIREMTRYISSQLNMYEFPAALIWCGTFNVYDDYPS